MNRKLRILRDLVDMGEPTYEEDYDGQIVDYRCSDCPVMIRRQRCYMTTNAEIDCTCGGHFQEVQNVSRFHPVTV